VEQSILLGELWLYKWQSLSRACIHGGKPIGKPWTIRVVGHCPFLNRDIRVQVRGSELGGLIGKLLSDSSLQACLRAMKERGVEL
jgi:hypothetical protein